MTILFKKKNRTGSIVVKVLKIESISMYLHVEFNNKKKPSMYVLSYSIIIFSKSGGDFFLKNYVYQFHEKKT